MQGKGVGEDSIEAWSDSVRGQIRLRKLNRMLQKQTQESSTEKRSLGKVWVSVPKNGLLTAHKLQLVILEVEAPKPGDILWVLRGLVCNAKPLVWYLFAFGSPYEIRYNPEKHTGTHVFWRAFPGSTIGEMQNLTRSLS